MDVEQAMKDADNMGTGADDHAAIAERVWAGTRWHYPQIERMADLIRTLAAEVRRLSGAVPAGCVRDEKGVDRQVVGPLPITRDGVVVCVGCEVFHPQQDQAFHLSVMAHDGGEDTEEFPIPNDCEYVGHYSYWEGDTGYSTYETYDIRQCYSTRAAAEAARERGPT